MKDSIRERVKEALRSGEDLKLELGNGRRLKIERKLPFLLVYRFSDERDRTYSELISGESSYLTASKTVNSDSKVIQLILSSSKLISEKYRAVMILEIWINRKERTKFTIKTGKEIATETVNAMQKGLSRYSRSHGLEVQVEHTRHRHPPYLSSLLTLDQCREAGIYLMGLEIPGFFIDDNQKEFYPLVYQNFKRFFSKLIRKSIYEFLRVQTTFGISHYHRLGTTTISKRGWRVEKQLTDLQNEYRFLLLISPLNTLEAKREFVDTNYEKAPKFIYRLLPVDPDRLKERLFNINIREVEDPTLRYLLLDKREELEKQITMLKERGTKNFFYSSIRLYNAVDKELHQQALAILEDIPAEEEVNESWADCHDLYEAAKNEIDHYQKIDGELQPEIEIKSDIVGMLVSQGNLYIGESFKTTSKQLKAMIHHEIGTHVLTHFNGSRQPFTQLSTGFADYDELQEGLAVFAEYLCGGLSANRLRILAARIVAGHSLTEGQDFTETFRTLYRDHSMDEKTSFDIAARIHQSGGCTKDIIYLRGLLHLMEYLRDGGDLEILFTGKIALKHVPLIKELKIREILKPPALLPRYLESSYGKERLEKARNGIQLKDMII